MIIGKRNKKIPFGEQLQTLSYEVLKELFNAKILSRGHSYYNQNSVSVPLIEPGLIKAWVQGRETYQTTIEEEDNKIIGSCTCPYYDGCKHLVAFLLYIQKMPNEDLKESSTERKSNPKNVFRLYVESLTKEELQKLVLHYAPKSFQDTIVVQASSNTEKTEMYLRVKKNIQQLFMRDLHDIGSFESELTALTEKLRGIWDVLPNEVAELFVYIIKQVNEAFDEGYLYEDYHYGESCYEGENFGRLMAAFIVALSGALKQSSFEKIWGALKGQDYGVFENFIPSLLELTSQETLSELKTVFLDSDALSTMSSTLARSVFEALSPVFTKTEQLELLKKLAKQDDYFAHKLASHHESQGKHMEAIQVLEKALQNEDTSFGWVKHDERDIVFQKIIALEHAQGNKKRVDSLLRDYVNEFSTSETLTFILTIVPKDTYSVFEQLLEKQCPEEYIVYLEEVKRLDEIPTIFKKYESDFPPQEQYDFYRRHQKVFPKELRHVGHIVLEQELTPTGQRHYWNVTGILQSLEHVIPKKEFKELLDEIKATYRRRRSLLQILSENGL